MVCVCACTVAFVRGAYVMHVLAVYVCVSDACTCAHRLKPEEDTGGPVLSSFALLSCSRVSHWRPCFFFFLGWPQKPPFLPGFPMDLNSSLHVSSANTVLFLRYLSHPRYHSILVQVMGESLSISLVKINISSFVTSL